MEKKIINKIQNEVKKASEKTLTGAVKNWCRMFNNAKDINEVLKECGIKPDKFVVSALAALAKDKETVISLCREILPRVDDTFVSFKEIEREYFDPKESEKNYTTPESKLYEIAVRGRSFKRFGYAEPIPYSVDEEFFIESYRSEEKRIVKAAIPVKRYTFSLIAKCVTYHLTHEKNAK